MCTNICVFQSNFFLLFWKMLISLMTVKFANGSLRRLELNSRCVFIYYHYYYYSHTL